MKLLLTLTRPDGKRFLVNLYQVAGVIETDEGSHLLIGRGTHPILETPYEVEDLIAHHIDKLSAAVVDKMASLSRGPAAFGFETVEPIDDVVSAKTTKRNRRTRPMPASAAEAGAQAPAATATAED